SAQNSARFRSANFTVENFWLCKEKAEEILAGFPSILTQQSRKFSLENLIQVAILRLTENTH
ncbi:MAG: hypothetical protein IJD11_00365, partial [Oscillospiraceae bacterium]|nr:hypothetical protein [Oscillospiraceae bacterium]